MIKASYRHLLGADVSKQCVFRLSRNTKQDTPAGPGGGGVQGTDKGLALSSQRTGMSASRSDDRAASQDSGSSALPCGQ